MGVAEMKALTRQKYEGYKQSDIDKSLAIFPAFSDFNVSVERQEVDGELVTSYWRMRGTHTGVFLGVPPTGKSVTITGFTTDRVQGGKVIEESSSLDFENFLHHLKSLL